MVEISGILRAAPSVTLRISRQRRIVAARRFCSAKEIFVFERRFSPSYRHQKKRTPLRTSFSFGGDKRDRTADLLNAIQALSQLSYTPVERWYYTTAYAILQALFFCFLFFDGQTVQMTS